MERYLKLEFYMPSSAPHCSLEMTTAGGRTVICKNEKERVLNEQLSRAFLEQLDVIHFDDLLSPAEEGEEPEMHWDLRYTIGDETICFFQEQTGGSFQLQRLYDLLDFFGEPQLEQVNQLHKAIVFATKAHAGQKRKGKDLDYISHPLEVLQILTEMRGSEELQIAGVLHDTVEDTDTVMLDILFQFGPRVAELVSGHSEDKSKSWKERKQHTIDSLATADNDLKMLIMADKVSNLRSTLADYREIGDEVWKRFSSDITEQCWYYGAVQDALYELQNHENTRKIYWEMVGLHKDLFVKFYLDMEQGMMWQLSVRGEAYRLERDNMQWIPTEPSDVRGERLERLEAEALLNLWSQQGAGKRQIFDWPDLNGAEVQSGTVS